jgi:hypothetical protein
MQIFLKKNGFLYFLIISCLLLVRCSDDESVSTYEPPTPKSYRERVIDYFVEIALGFEFGTASAVTRKWMHEIRIYVGGNKTTEMMTELNRVIGELEELSENLKLRIVSDTLESNYYIFFGSGMEFANRFPPAQANVASNWGLFYVYFNSLNEITRGVMYVDIERTTDANARKHLLREELTQSLGLAKDSYAYPESIFYQPWSTVTEFAPIDRDLIRLLYHEDMPTGIFEPEVREILEVLTEELEIGA